MFQDQAGMDQVEPATRQPVLLQVMANDGEGCVIEADQGADIDTGGQDRALAVTWPNPAPT
jgi:hypothetical protein